INYNIVNNTPVPSWFFFPTTHLRVIPNNNDMVGIPFPTIIRVVKMRISEEFGDYLEKVCAESSKKSCSELKNTELMLKWPKEIIQRHSHNIVSFGSNLASVAILNNQGLDVTAQFDFNSAN